MIEIEADYTSLYNKLIQKRDQSPDILALVVNESGMAGHGIVVSKAPIDEGTLRGSHRVESRGLLERVIFPDQGVAPHALFVILGTKPHIIMGKPYLSFKGKNGRVLLGRKLKNATKPGIVHHPGTKPNDYMKKSIPAIKSEIESNLEEFKNWLME